MHTKSHIPFNAKNHLLHACMLAVLCSLFGYGQQQPKRALVPEDYKLWSYLEAKGISASGNWASYVVSHDDGQDTLFVQNTIDRRCYTFPHGHEGSFLGDDCFACLDPSNTCTMVNLRTGSVSYTNDVSAYYFIPNNNRPLIMMVSQDRKKIIIKEIKGSHFLEIQGVNEHVVDMESKRLVVATVGEESRLSLFDANKLQLCPLLSDTTATFNNIALQCGGKIVTFVLQGIKQQQNRNTKSIQIGYYQLQARKLYTFTPPHKSSGNGLPIGIGPMTVSADQKRLFFTILGYSSTKPGDTLAQVWNSQDKYLQPVPKMENGSVKSSQTAVWWPRTGKYTQLNDNTYSELTLTENGRFAILWDPVADEPQPYADSARNYKSVDLETGNETLFLTKFPYLLGKLSVSPGGQFINYFYKGNWWLYELATNKHSNLTKNNTGEFEMQGAAYPGESLPWGNPGWTLGDKDIYIYDEFDIWKICIKTNEATRITQGRETATTFRFATNTAEQRSLNSYNGNTSMLLGNDIPLIISSTGTSKNALWLLASGPALQPIAQEEARLSLPVLSKDNTAVMYIAEKYDNPPKLMLRDLKTEKTSLIFQSNPQHGKFHWGSAKMIRYSNSQGQQMKGILYYPANFDPDRLYPMIVHIYDKQSGHIHDYINPGFNNGNGFNISNYATKGYFVLLPDIIYQTGNPGLSAADCVIAATKKALSLAPVDPKKVGLIGHSFGGYETDFIITQTDIFATAVAGAAITDLVSSYLYVSWNYTKPNFWHYESGQLRMGTSLNGDYKAYVENSPVYHAAKVTTPLLSWAGEDDRQVHTYQSIEFYLALRRLGKEHIMLLYPGQRHVLTDAAQQRHLTEHIEQWFDYYLRGGPKQSWMIKN